MQKINEHKTWIKLDFVKCFSTDAPDDQPKSGSAAKTDLEAGRAVRRGGHGKQPGGGKSRRDARGGGDRPCREQGKKTASARIPGIKKLMLQIGRGGTA